ncbi:hypothetical protein Sm713_63170 [Streptomyces sp. TS71-3]|nr:hypothetical protein Sm713_63170 [Streptomyces sp. TS71-3]
MAERMGSGGGIGTSKASAATLTFLAGKARGSGLTARMSYLRYPAPSSQRQPGHRRVKEP